MTLIVTPSPITPPAITPPALSIPLQAAGVTFATVTAPVPAVQPPAVQPGSITVPDAEMITSLENDGYVVAAASSSGTGSSGGTGTSSTPSGAGLVGSGTGPWNGTIIDKAGQFDPYFGGTPVPVTELSGAPAGNWDNGCTLTPGAIAPDGAPALLVTPTGSYDEAILHPIGVAGNPSPNGIGIAPPAGSKYYVADICPVPPGVAKGAPSGLTLSAYFNQCQGAGSYVGPNPPVTVADVPYPTGAVYLSGNGAPILPAGVFTTVKVLLSAMGWPLTNGNTAPTFFYKESIQENSPMNGMPYYIRNHGCTET
jgi:hypothetical protein